MGGPTLMQIDKLSGLFKKQIMKLEGEHVRGNMGRVRAYINIP